MTDVDKAIQTQLANIQKKTGKTLEELYAWLRATGLAKHGELRDAAKSGLGLGHGDANTLVTLHLRATGATVAPAASAGAAEDEIYSGPKAALRPIHDRVMAAIAGFGPFEIAPKKGYLSLRRKKQFAMVGPATKTPGRGRPQRQGPARRRAAGRPAARWHVPVQSASRRSRRGRRRPPRLDPRRLRRRG